MAKPLSIVFPGQGSQSVGMLAALAEAYPLVKETFDEASEAVGLDLWRLSQEGPEEILGRTENTQPAMLAAGVAVFRVWQAQGGPIPAIVAGHSLGEYSAVVASGALDFAVAARLVARRGRLMQEAVPAGTGAMAAILGLDDAAVLAVCRETAAGEVVEAVNFNSPGQVVIGGHATAVGRALDRARELGAKRAVMLALSVPSHCALMRGASKQLAAELEKLELRPPGITVLHNADVAGAAEPAAIRDKLIRQLYSPVRWVETVRRIADEGIGLIVEAGPGKVLSGLVRRIDRGIRALSVADPAELEKALEAAHE
jgi:[acyl-carrier-protein] S-malonyltransferase